jgi:hypothetical protein
LNKSDTQKHVQRKHVQRASIATCKMVALEECKNVEKWRLSPTIWKEVRKEKREILHFAIFLVVVVLLGGGGRTTL